MPESWMFSVNHLIYKSKKVLHLLKNFSNLDPQVWFSDKFGFCSSGFGTFLLIAHSKQKLYYDNIVARYMLVQVWILKPKCNFHRCTTVNVPISNKFGFRTGHFSSIPRHSEIGHMSDFQMAFRVSECSLNF